MLFSQKVFLHAPNTQGISNKFYSKMFANSVKNLGHIVRYNKDINYYCIVRIQIRSALTATAMQI